MDAFATRTSLPHLCIAELHGCVDCLGMDGHFAHAGGGSASTPLVRAQRQALQLHSLGFRYCGAAPSSRQHIGQQL